MMKKTLVGLGVVALMLGGAVNASATSVSDAFAGWTQIANDDGILDPGAGGQVFDAEYLYYKLDGTMLSIGLQTGFDVYDGEQDYDGKTYYAGDLALSFDGDNADYEYAFDFGFATMDYNGVAVGGQVDSGLYEVNKWNRDNAILFGTSNPFAMESGSLVTNGSTSASWDENVESYWRTVTFDLATFGSGFSYSGFDAHWTMSCGNDAINGTAPVPEPATMLLFGSGLVGLIGARRRKKK